MRRTQRRPSPQLVLPLLAPAGPLAPLRAGQDHGQRAPDVRDSGPLDGQGQRLQRPTRDTLPGPVKQGTERLAMCQRRQGRPNRDRGLNRLFLFFRPRRMTPISQAAWALASPGRKGRPDSLAGLALPRLPRQAWGSSSPEAVRWLSGGVACAGQPGPPERGERRRSQVCLDSCRGAWRGETEAGGKSSHDNWPVLPQWTTL